MISFYQFIETKKPNISSDDIVDWVMKHHYNPEDIDSGDLIQRIQKYDLYELEMIPIEKIDADEWYTDSEQVEDYEIEIKKKPDYPPIIVDEDLTIIDGTHRAKAIKNLGYKFIKAYVPVK